MGGASTQECVKLYISTSATWKARAKATGGGDRSLTSSALVALLRSGVFEQLSPTFTVISTILGSTEAHCVLEPPRQKAEPELQSFWVSFCFFYTGAVESPS